MVVLLQDVLRLVDEDRRALETLPAVGDLLGQLPQLHHLQREAKVLRERHAEGGLRAAWWPGPPPAGSRCFLGVWESVCSCKHFEIKGEGLQ